MHEEVTRQRDYYENTASSYDAHHTDAEHEHDFNARWFSLFIEASAAKSLLDVGTGTGRLLRHFRSAHPDLKTVGIEPVAALRRIAHDKHGFTPEQVLDGNACALPFPDNSFDWVCESAVLHHIKNPNLAVAEMIRVARIGIMLSDSNRFGQGRRGIRPIKYLFWKCGLWPLVTLVQTRGRGYLQSAEDGISYSYSLFDHLPLLRAHRMSVHTFNPEGRGISPLFDSATPGLVAVKPGVRLDIRLKV